jgi:hypothetical protein
VPLSPLLAAYCHYRTSHCGVATGTLQRDVETAKAFLAVLRRQGKSTGRATIADIDDFVGYFELLEGFGRFLIFLSAASFASAARLSLSYRDMLSG